VNDVMILCAGIVIGLCLHCFIRPVILVAWRAWCKKLYDKRAEIERLRDRILMLQGRGDYAFDAEKVPAAKYNRWTGVRPTDADLIARKLACFKVPIEALKKFSVVVFTRTHGAYRCRNVSHIFRDVPQPGKGRLEILVGNQEVFRGTVLERFIVLNGEDEVVADSDIRDKDDYPVFLAKGDTLNLFYDVHQSAIEDIVTKAV
jgi:hypothetical protein